MRLAQEPPQSSVLDHTDHGDESTYLTSSVTETPPPSDAELTEDVEVVVESTAVTFTTPIPTETPPPANTSGHRLFRSSSSQVKQQQRSAVENLPAVSEKKYMTPPKSSGFFFRSQPSSDPTNTMKHHHHHQQQHAPVSRSLFFTSNNGMGRNPGKNNQKNTAVGNQVALAGVNSDVIASHTAIDTSTATEKGANAKLPHGLTVQELKQMTKARLQAEASSFIHNSDGNMMNPTGPAATPPPPSRRSPYPMIYDNSSETWDTASVSTTCTSEFLFPAIASAEVNMILPPNSMGQDASIPFERTTSYPNTSPHLQHQHAGSVVNNSHIYGMFHHSSYANDVVGPTPFNRNRAATSSPRLGISSTAMYQHSLYNNNNSNMEDTSYPYHPNYSTIHNNISSVMPVDETLPFQNEYGYYPRSVANNYNNNNKTTMIDTNGISAYESNRIRTSSLPSVLLPTAIENDVDPASQLNLRGINLTALMEPTPQMDDDANKSNTFVAGLSDTFQSPSSFPSFYSGMSEPPARYRASTWTDAVGHTSIDDDCATGMAPTSSLLLFGNVGGIAADSMTTTDVSDDLASILKLSTTTTASLSSEPQPMGHNQSSQQSSW